MNDAAVTIPAADLVLTGRIRRGQEWTRGRIWVAAGRIVAITGVEVEVPAERAQVDVGSAFLLPGAVDAHVHSLSHAGEGVDAATSAAAAGGVTTIVEMPFDGTGPINSLDRLAAKQDLVTTQARIDVALLATLEPGGGWRATGGLVEAGAVGFKVSLFLTDPARFPRIDDHELQSVMAAAAETGTTLCTHAENNEIIKGLLADPAAQASTDPMTHVRTRPPVSETLGVLTALESAAHHGVSLHVCHLSLPRSVDLVTWYRSQGTDVTLEICPHYLAFTEDDMATARGRLKINPPLRTAADRDGLWDRLRDGAVDVISSDHAPWPLALKDKDVILDNHSGVPGVETLVVVTLAEALRRDPSLELFTRAVDALTLAPARRYGIDHVKGSLEVGKDADIIAFDPDLDTTIDEAELHSNAGWSPYAGRAYVGALTHTWSRGRLAWSKGQGLLHRPGDGQLVARAR